MAFDQAPETTITKGIVGGVEGEAATKGQPVWEHPVSYTFLLTCVNYKEEK